jgi:hypothetical protein
METLPKIYEVISDNTISPQDKINAVLNIVFDDNNNETRNPRLFNDDEIYYSGYGPTWGVDLDGKFFDYLYSTKITKDISGKFKHLKNGDIIDNEKRKKEICRQFVFDLLNI